MPRRNSHFVKSLRPWPLRAHACMPVSRASRPRPPLWGEERKLHSAGPRAVEDLSSPWSEPRARWPQAAYGEWGAQRLGRALRVHAVSDAAEEFSLCEKPLSAAVRALGDGRGRAADRLWRVRCAAVGPCSGGAADVGSHGGVLTLSEASGGGGSVRGRAGRGEGRIRGTSMRVPARLGRV